MKHRLPPIDETIRRALEEDVGKGDVTTRSTVPQGTQGRFLFVAREPLVACGLPVAARVFTLLDRKVRTEPLAQEGARVPKGAVLMEVAGPAGSILTGERLALNLLQHLSSIATHTARFVQAVEGTGAKVLDTRKTTPGLRSLEKYAVRCGGGVNHRMGLYDAVLIKDNHISAAGSVTQAVKAARRRTRLPIEVECDTLAQVREALAAGADRLLLDNMPPRLLRQVVAMRPGVPLEASGGVSLKTIRAIARTGVDYISVGQLTHSAPHVDIGLDSGPEA